MLGKATETTSGNQRILKWSLVDHNARRLEEGVPRTEREVGLVMGTTTWGTVSRALRETLVALQDHDEIPSRKNGGHSGGRRFRMRLWPQRQRGRYLQEDKVGKAKVRITRIDEVSTICVGKPK